MPARRDYVEAWRDAWVTLAQVPVAGLLAADYFYQQWVQRSSTYLSHVSARFALARPAESVAGGSGDNVAADVLSEDLVDTTRALVRDLVSLPGEAATYFNRRLQEMIREVLMRIQPDAQTDLRTYLINELERLNRELHRLREVAGAEAVRRDQAVSAGEPAPPSQRDRSDKDPLEKVLDEIKKIVETSRDGRPGEGKPMPSERLLLVIQDIVNAAWTHFPGEPVAEPDIAEVRLVKERATRHLLALQRAQVALEQAKRDIDDERKGAARPRARRQLGPTRRPDQ